MTDSWWTLRQGETDRGRSWLWTAASPCGWCGFLWARIYMVLVVDCQIAAAQRGFNHFMMKRMQKAFLGYRFRRSRWVQEAGQHRT